MQVIPAVDIKNGRCVRLRQGRMDDETVYAENPVEAAKRWEQAGAKLLHVVDLDGAVGGVPKNKRVIQEIAAAVSIPLQVGGGIRNIKTIEDYLAAGIHRVILGTAAVLQRTLVTEACRRFPKCILAGIDAVDGRVAVDGWKTVTQEKATDLAIELEGIGLAAIVYTDIKRDGMLSGPNLDAIRQLIACVSTPVIASGGVTTLEDLKSLKQLESLGLSGAIIGKALYAGTLDLAEALSVAEGVS
ncbi:MAG TPA: 1-(5-phosphoribosyl)-5-[(5-phosphoribosylamino)methylideneamino]imidazole-4-carboxamide isomerase [Nitrospiria bacterium]|nr:1-(5-phosphoribosyl)-5-[(5-phosphoribosylamino)methylideneamino]imidazole-4-carboxamide isomerase [Nitrospiria bacterium]